MSKIRLTKEFEFEAAHALHNYDGLCSNVHGHSYKLSVTIIGSPLKDNNSPKKGMVMDFGLIKNIIKENIVNQFDHSIIFNKAENFENLETDNNLFNRIHIFDFQPTAENLIVYFSNLIIDKFPENVKLFSLKLHETSTSYVEWYADDQI